MTKKTIITLVCQQNSENSHAVKKGRAQKREQSDQTVECMRQNWLNNLSFKKILRSYSNKQKIPFPGLYSKDS